MEPLAVTGKTSVSQRVCVVLNSTRGCFHSPEVVNTDTQSALLLAARCEFTPTCVVYAPFVFMLPAQRVFLFLSLYADMYTKICGEIMLVVKLKFIE